jgi:hypothetical protein
MKIIKTIQTLYTFEELIGIGGKALDRAREKLHVYATDHDWYDYIQELWQNALEQTGFEDAEIQFSGFCSQGDGASFTSRVNTTKLVEFLLSETAPRDCIPGLPEGGEDFRGYIVGKVHGLPTPNPVWRHLPPLFDNGYAEMRVERSPHQYAHEHTCHVSSDLRDEGEHGCHSNGTTNWDDWQSYTPRVRKAFDSFVEAVEELRLDLCQAIYAALEEEYDHLGSDEYLSDFAEGNEWYFDGAGKLTCFDPEDVEEDEEITVKDVPPPRKHGHRNLLRKKGGQ